MSKQRLVIHLIGWIGGLGLSAGLQATELVYSPVNPSFGGNPLNGSWLLSNAQAQDDEEDPDARSRSSYTAPTALERFSNQLESRLLSDFLSDVSAGNDGSLTTDDFIVNVVNDSGVLTIHITDRLTGEISEVVVDGWD